MVLAHGSRGACRMCLPAESRVVRRCREHDIDRNLPLIKRRKAVPVTMQEIEGAARMGIDPVDMFREAVCRDLFPAPRHLVRGVRKMLMQGIGPDPGSRSKVIGEHEGCAQGDVRPANRHPRYQEDSFALETGQPPRLMPKRCSGCNREHVGISRCLGVYMLRGKHSEMIRVPLRQSMMGQDKQADKMTERAFLRLREKSEPDQRLRIAMKLHKLGDSIQTCGIDCAGRQTHERCRQLRIGETAKQNVPDHGGMQFVTNRICLGRAPLQRTAQLLLEQDGRLSQIMEKRRDPDCRAGTDLGRRAV